MIGGSECGSSCAAIGTLDAGLPGRRGGGNRAVVFCIGSDSIDFL